MIDEPGPWGTGPFTLTEGFSSITTRTVITNRSPFSATNLIESEQRSPRLVLTANLDHWNRRDRGPRVEKAVFRNDLDPATALDLCLSTDGEVDIVTEVSPADAARVEASERARLVVADANRVLVGIVNRNATDVPLGDRRVRQALNHAVDNARVVEQGLHGYASVIPALTPPWCSGFDATAPGYAHDPDRALELLGDAWPAGRALRLAAPEAFGGVADLVADDLRAALGVEVEVLVVPDADMPVGSRMLVEHVLDVPWDVLVFGWFDLSSEAPPAAVHREFFGLDGAFRAGPPDPGFDALYDEMKVQVDGDRLVEVATRIDRYVHDEALALFLCAPQALYAVNRHVSFGPYRTTFEIAEVTVDEGHWSRRDGGAGAPTGGQTVIGDGSPAAGTAVPGYGASGAGDTSGGGSGDAPGERPRGKPGFSGAAGNAC